jgi:uncharacterized protein with HEPN domain
LKKEDIIYLHHIIDAIERIEEYTSGLSYDEYLKSHLVQDGVITQIEIIGEASKKLSKEIKDKVSDLPWKDIAGMRDKLIHDYMGVDIDAVWETVRKDIPDLKKKLKSIFTDR